MRYGVPSAQPGRVAPFRDAYAGTPDERALMATHPQSTDRRTSRQQLWLLRGACFAQYSGIALLWAYQTVWMKDQGMGEFFIGRVSALTTVLTLVCGLAYGYIADATGRPNRMVLVGSVVCSFTMAYFARCSTAGQFVIYAVLAGVGMPLMLNMLSLLAVSVVEGSGSAGRRYGTYRLFGSLGYGLSAIILPAFVPRIPSMLYIGAALVLVPILPVLAIRPSPRVDHTHGRIRPVLRNRELMAFYVAVFFFALAAPAIFQFTPIYARRLGAGDRFIGLLAAMLGLVSIVGLPLSGWLADRYGPRVLLIFPLLAQPARALWFSFVGSYGYLLLPQLLHTITFAGMEVGAVLYVTRLAGRQSRGTALSMYAASQVLARAIASPIAGYLAQEVGYPAMYRISAAVGALGLVIFLTLAAAGRKPRADDPAAAPASP
jgi:PPP family 3-phenylpropionic acid transporter